MKMDEEKDIFSYFKGAAVLVSAGEDLAEEELKKVWDQAPLVYCADGGFDRLYQLGLSPDYLLGDFDSSALIQEQPELLEEYRRRGRLLSFPVHKDKTDTELGLDQALQDGCQRLYLFGGIGSRLDHSLANLFFLPVYAKKGLHIALYAKNNRALFLPAGRYCFSRPDPAFYQSFLAYGDGVRLSLHGFEYPLDSFPLEEGSSLGISNHILEEKGVVLVEAGEGRGVLAIQSRDGRRKQGK